MPTHDPRPPSPTPAEVGARLVTILSGGIPDPGAGAPADATSVSGIAMATDSGSATAGVSGGAAAGAFGGVTAGVSGGGAWARATVDVPSGRWTEAVRAARDGLGCDFFDWLTAVDELDQGFSVVVHVWSIAHRFGVLLRTRVPRDAARVDSIVPIYPGAAWPERETYEMFAIDFTGHEPITPLLLPPEFEGHPLRKEFVLASRVAKPWPGATEPGESAEPGAARRPPMRPPGVPEPGQWGPPAAG